MQYDMHYGRRTYIVEYTCEFIVKNRHLLSEKDKYIMTKDIRRQEEYGYGDECDKQEWMRLLAILENEN